MRSRTRPTRALAALLAVSCIVACGDDEQSLDGQAIADATAAPLTQEVNASIPTAALARRGEDRTAEYKIERWTDVDYEATDMVFLPDGRALLLEKGGWAPTGTGAVKLLDSDGALIRDILDLPVCPEGERGLLSIVLDPDFESNAYFYLFYTRQMEPCPLSGSLQGVREPVASPVWNRVSRFTFDERGVDASSELIIVDELPGHQSSHNGGGLAFLPDGTLLVGVGEATYLRSRELDFVAGKVLRVSVDGSGVAPPDNPFEGGDVESLVYASGLRNPFRIAVEAATGVVAVGEVGTDDWEEVNLIEAGHDYGFPDIEGPGSDNGSAEPALVYPHEDGCISIIGGGFVPASFVRDATSALYTFSDLGCGGVWAMSVDGTGEHLIRLAGPLGYGLASMVYGPDGALYLVGIGPGPQPVARLVRTAS